jgi:hypothetical protein
VTCRVRCIAKALPGLCVRVDLEASAQRAHAGAVKPEFAKGSSNAVINRLLVLTLNMQGCVGKWAVENAPLGSSPIASECIFLEDGSVLDISQFKIGRLVPVTKLYLAQGSICASCSWGLTVLGHHSRTHPEAGLHVWKCRNGATVEIDPIDV